MNRIVCSAALLYSFAFAQIQRVAIPYIEDGERIETILPAGVLVYDQDAPSRVFIGDGSTPGGHQVSPATPEWDHVATRDITLGAYKALFGDYAIYAENGAATWALSSVPLLRLSGDDRNISISASSYNPTTRIMSLTVDVGTSTDIPQIFTTTDLLSSIWSPIEPTSIGAVASEKRVITVEVPENTTLLFFRAVLPAQRALLDIIASAKVAGDFRTLGGSTSSEGFFATDGDAQILRQVLRARTTDATPTDLTRNGSALDLPAGRLWAGTVHVAGIGSSGSPAAYYARKFAIKNIGGATALVGSVSTVGIDMETAASYNLAITADDATDTLKVTVTGAASETLRWVGTLELIDIEVGP